MAGSQDGAVWKLPCYQPTESLLLLLGAAPTTQWLKRQLRIG